MSTSARAPPLPAEKSCAPPSPNAPEVRGLSPRSIHQATPSPQPTPRSTRLPLIDTRPVIGLRHPTATARSAVGWTSTVPGGQSTPTLETAFSLVVLIETWGSL